MYTVYRLKASDIDQRFIDGLKATFQDREIEIVVYEIDETAYLMASPANRDRLLQAIDNIHNRNNLVEVDLEKLG
jgi:antitoxin YefM